MARLYSILDALIAKISTYNIYTNKLCNRFTTVQTLSRASTTVASGFANNNTRHNVVGGRAYFLSDTTKSSSWSTGNITGVTMITITVDLTLEHGVLQDSGFAAYGLCGSKGGLKKIYAGRSSGTANLNQKYFVVEAVDTADTAAIFSDCCVVRYNALL